MVDNKEDNVISFIAQTDVIARIIQFLENTDVTVYVPALRAIGNILTANDPAVIDRALFNNVLDALTPMLFQSNSNIIKETLWAFSNVTASAENHCEAFVNSKAVERVLYLTQSTNIDHRTEALWVLCNCITTCNFNVRHLLLQMSHRDILKALI